MYAVERLQRSIPALPISGLFTFELDEIFTQGATKGSLKVEIRVVVDNKRGLTNMSLLTAANCR